MTRYLAQVRERKCIRGKHVCINKWIEALALLPHFLDSFKSFQKVVSFFANQVPRIKVVKIFRSQVQYLFRKKYGA